MNSMAKVEAYFDTWITADCAPPKNHRHGTSPQDWWRSAPIWLRTAEERNCEGVLTRKPETVLGRCVWPKVADRWIPTHPELPDSAGKMTWKESTHEYQDIWGRSVSATHWTACPEPLPPGTPPMESSNASDNTMINLTTPETPMAG